MRSHCGAYMYYGNKGLAEIGVLSGCAALQVWIILELCTGGTLLDAALCGKLRLGSDADGTDGRLGMVRVVLHAAIRVLAGHSLLACGLHHHSSRSACVVPAQSTGVCCTTPCYMIWATADSSVSMCDGWGLPCVFCSQAKLLCRLLDAAHGMAYLHSKGVMHVSVAPPHGASVPVPCWR